MAAEDERDFGREQASGANSPFPIAFQSVNSTENDASIHYNKDLVYAILSNEPFSFKCPRFVYCKSLSIQMSSVRSVFSQKRLSSSIGQKHIDIVIARLCV